VFARAVQLKARGLPIADRETKSSDPYLKFYGSFLGDSARTPVVQKQLNPDWADKDVPVLASTFNSRHRLRASALLIKVMDKDVGKDDTLADGILFLADAVNAADGKAHCKVDVQRGGLPHGYVEFDLQIKWAPLTAADTLLSAQDLNKFGFKF
jgi:Ca2+-dependent lipid-binding protein